MSESGSGGRGSTRQNTTPRGPIPTFASDVVVSVAGLGIALAAVLCGRLPPPVSRPLSIQPDSRVPPAASRLHPAAEVRPVSSSVSRATSAGRVRTPRRTRSPRSPSSAARDREATSATEPSASVASIGSPVRRPGAGRAGKPDRRQFREHETDDTQNDRGQSAVNRDSTKYLAHDSASVESWAIASNIDTRFPSNHIRSRDGALTCPCCSSAPSIRRGRSSRTSATGCRAAGVAVTVVDAGVLGPPAFEPDITRDAVFAAAGTNLRRGEGGRRSRQGRRTRRGGSRETRGRLAPPRESSPAS